MKVLAQLHSLGVPSAKIGVEKMLSLVFSKDPKVSEIVTLTYRALYLGDKTSNAEKSKGLISLISQANLVGLTCIEEFIRQSKDEKSLKQIFYELWFEFSGPMDLGRSEH